VRAKTISQRARDEVLWANCAAKSTPADGVTAFVERAGIPVMLAAVLNIAFICVHFDVSNSGMDDALHDWNIAIHWSALDILYKGIGALPVSLNIELKFVAFDVSNGGYSIMDIQF
jgi:hypothetical protein